MPGIPGGAMPGAANTASPGASPQIPIQQSGGAPVVHAAGGGAVRHFDDGGSPGYVDPDDANSGGIFSANTTVNWPKVLDNINNFRSLLNRSGDVFGFNAADNDSLRANNHGALAKNPAYDPNSTSLLPSGAALHGNPAYNPNYTSLLPPPTASYSNEGRNSTPPQDTDSASGLPAVAPPEANPYERYSPATLATFDTSTPVRPANSDYTLSNVPSSSETQKALDQYRTANPQRLADYQKMADNAGTAAWLQQMAAPHGGGLGASIGPAYGADLNAQNGVVQQRMQYEDNREKMAAELSHYVDTDTINNFWKNTEFGSQQAQQSFANAILSQQTINTAKSYGNQGIIEEERIQMGYAQAAATRAAALIGREGQMYTAMENNLNQQKQTALTANQAQYGKYADPNSPYFSMPEAAANRARGAYELAQALKPINDAYMQLYQHEMAAASGVEDYTARRTGVTPPPKMQSGIGSLPPPSSGTGNASDDVETWAQGLPSKNNPYRPPPPMPKLTMSDGSPYVYTGPKNMVPGPGQQ